jgi:hypothetical protein
MPNVGDLKIKEGRLKRIKAIDRETGTADIEDLGEAVPVSVDGNDRVLQFELDGKPMQVGAWGPDGSIREYIDYQKFKGEAPKDDLNIPLEVGKGFAKGAGQTVTTIAKGINAIPGIGEALSPKVGIDQLEQASRLENTPQKVGAVGEQIAEMSLTGGPIKKGLAAVGAKAIPLLSKVPAALRAAPKVVAVGSEAINAAGNAALHGEDPGVAAAWGAGGAAVGELATASAPALKKGAKEQYGRVMAATTKKSKEAAERTIPELIKRGEIGSEASLLNKAKTQVTRLGGQIDDAVKAVDPQDRVDASQVLNALEDYKKSFMVDGVEVDPQAVANVTELQNVISNIVGEGKERAFGGVPYQSLNRVRQIWDEKVSKAGGYGVKDLADGSKVDAMAEGANAIRAELAKAQPDIAKINQEFRLWRSVNDVLEATETRRVGQAGGLRKVLAPSTAVAVGGGSYGYSQDPIAALTVGAGTLAAMSLVDTLAKSGRWNTLNAVAKDRLADAIMTGNGEVLAELIGRTGAAASGKLPENAPSLRE